MMKNFGFILPLTEAVLVQLYRMASSPNKVPGFRGFPRTSPSFVTSSEPSSKRMNEFSEKKTDAKLVVGNYSQPCLTRIRVF